MKSWGVRGMVCAGLLCLPMMVLAQQNQAPSPNEKWWSGGRGPTAAPSPPSDAAPGVTTEVATTTASEPAPGAIAPVMAGAVSLKDFDCVEVQRFEVGSGFISSKEDARAATIPAEKLGAIQREVAGQIPEKLRGYRSTLVADGSPKCPDPSRALVLSGRVTDFKEGNQALRYWVGFGAGAQKFGVLVRATRKSDGSVVGEGEVVDRKVGGWIGGQADKGLEDFAEKVAGFLKASLQSR
jgi:uncharacterized protein DUF4410